MDGLMLPVGQTRARVGSWILIGISILIPTLVLIGWAVNILVLRTVLPQFTPMNPVTASCFLLSGVALAIEQLFANSRANRSFSYVIGVMCVVIGISMFLFYLSGIDLHVDRILFTTKLGINRMALGTCIGISFLGVCLLTRPYLKVLVRLSYIAIAVIGVYALTAYLYSFVGVYGHTVFNPIAVHTAFVFLILVCYFVLEDIGTSQRFTQLRTTLLISILLVITGIVISSYLYGRERNDTETALVSSAEVVHQSLALQDLSMLTGTTGDLASPAYMRVKQLLITTVHSNSSIDFAYVLGKTAEGNIFFYADSEDSSSPDYSPPGQVYSEASPLLRDIWAHPQTRMEGPTRDRWGTWVSGFVPVINKEGTVISVIGIDRDGEQYQKAILFASLTPLLVALLLAGIVFFLGLRRVRQVQTNTRTRTV